MKYSKSRDVRKISVADSVKSDAKSMQTNEQFNTHTILESGTGQLVGNIAELVFKSQLESLGIDYDYVAQSEFAHDFICSGLKIDIKAKARNVSCRGDYNAHVCRNQSEFDCDIYVFASYNKKVNELEFLGFIWRKIFWQKCESIKQNSVDKDRFTHLSDSGIVKYQELSPMDELVQILELVNR